MNCWQRRFSPNWRPADELCKSGDGKEVVAGSARRVVLDGLAIALVRTADGTLFAVEDTCTHEDASLAEGFVAGGVIECPRHGARFELATGVALSLPAVEAVRTYEVKIANGEILVNLN